MEGAHTSAGALPHSPGPSPSRPQKTFWGRFRSYLCVQRLLKYAHRTMCCRYACPRALRFILFRRRRGGGTRSGLGGFCCSARTSDHCCAMVGGAGFPAPTAIGGVGARVGGGWDEGEWDGDGPLGEHHGARGFDHPPSDCESDDGFCEDDGFY